MAQDKLLNLSESQPPHLTTVGNDTLWGACGDLVRQNVGLALANSEAPLALESGCDVAEGGVSPGGFKFMMLIQERTECQKPRIMIFVGWKEKNTPDW